MPTQEVLKQAFTYVPEILVRNLVIKNPVPERRSYKQRPDSVVSALVFSRRTG